MVNQTINIDKLILQKVNDLKERLLHRAPFAPPLDSAGFAYGFNSLFLPKVLDFWQKEYNFEERERFLNKYNHFITGIQGLDVHYMHVKPDLGDGGDITVSNFKFKYILLK